MSERNEYDWIAERFDRVDSDNADIKDKLEVVTATVNRHGVYWDIVKWGAVSGGGLAAAIAGFLGFHKHD